MSYTNATLVGNFLQRTLTSDEIALLNTLIPAVQIYIDDITNSTFDQVEESTRYYDGGVESVDIDPCTAITAVKTIDNSGSDNTTYTTVSDYIAYPQNKTVKNELRKRYGAWARGAHRIAVSAKFSEYDGKVPEDIQIVATRLAVGYINAGKRADTSNISSESLEGHSINYDQASSSTLDGIAMSDPTVQSILGNRRELYVDDVEPVGNNDDDEDLLI